MRAALRRLAVLTAVAGVYFVAGKLGLRIAIVHPSATAVWAPTGIALTAFLTLGYGITPAIFVAAFLVNVTTAGTTATSLGIATGNTIEGVLGAYLVTRFARGRQALERPPDVFRFTVLAALVSTAVSATCGVATLVAGRLAGWADYGSIWLTWWLGDVGGDLVVAPALLIWIAHPRVRWTRSQAVEAAALAVALLAVGAFVFALPVGESNPYPLEFLCVPLFIWAAYRFGQREAATAIVLIAAVAIWGTVHGSGPFAREAPNESLLLLTAFMGVVSVTSLILAAVVAERRRAEEQLRQLVVTDPLTGLANYRQLIGVLEGEVRRYGRTERPFAVVLFDLDKLKKINDRYGHLVGSQALCRLAELLHSSCRAIDTAARFGGDEFALVLPETDEAAARRVADRVIERLSRDVEKPKLSVSAGVAVYPRDGDTVERLLGSADSSLYESKRRGAPTGRASS